MSRSLVCALILFFGAALGAHAAILRGRLVAQGPSGQFPVAGIAVTVLRPDLGRSPPSYSSQDGMYYLNVPAGLYTLEVWFSRDPRVAPMRYQIQVREPNTDLAPIKLP